MTDRLPIAERTVTRRTVLKGLGAAVGLPFLESLAPSGALSAAAPPPPPVRTACLFMANGVHPDAWTPKGEADAFQLSPILAPLEPLRSEILVLTNLWNAGSQGGDGHYVKTSGWLTGTTITKTTGKDLNSGGISLDQLIAQRTGDLTRIPSLELAIDPVTTGIDTNVNYTRLYGSHISWSSPTTPVTRELDPQLVFERLFRTEEGARSRKAGDDRSVLDLVQEDARRLLDRVGREDRLKVQEYLESVRAVEKRIEFDARGAAEDRAERAGAAVGELAERIRIHRGPRAGAPGGGRDHTEYVRLMLDLMVLAFWTDSTRVCTFMFGNAVSPRNFSFLEGVGGGHHEISHHQGDASKLEQYKRINIWHVQQYAYMLERLRSVPDGDGTLLDHSMILFGSGLRDGNRHDPHNLPIVLGGRGGGAIRTGRHLVHEKDTPLCNLYHAMLERAGIRVERFGDSTEPLKDLAG